MKYTALQKLKQKILSKSPNNADTRLFKVAILNDIEEAIIKEKDQITEAYRKGVEDERYNTLDFIYKPYYESVFHNQQTSK